MGWTETRPTHYKKGGVDRKAEMDERWTQREHDGYAELNVLKSVMVGTHYYAAIEVKRNGVREYVFATTALTSIRDGWFGYKDMDETMGPYLYECPKSILDLLTETDNELAIEWRVHCREYLQKKRKGKTLNTLPVNAIIEITFDGKQVRLQKKIRTVNWRTGRTSYMWTDGFYRYPVKLFRDNFKIIENEEKEM